MATFLLIDDSAVARAFLRRILESQGHTIVGEAEDGLLGWDMYAKCRPDYVTIDMTMPRLNGLECLKKIKADFPDAKPIIVSALGKHQQREEALSLGAIQYITKPLDNDEVLEVIKSL